MHHLSKQLLIALGLLTGAYCVAISPGLEEHRAPCPHIFKKERCLNYPTKECTWSHDCNICTYRNAPSDRCTQIKRYFSCIKSPHNCYWDEDTRRCKPKPTSPEP